jgi:amphi-Trp domain-containing protein
MAPHDRFKHESLEDNETIARYLKALWEGFEQGSLQFSTDDRQLQLQPQGLISLEVEAKRKDEDVKLALKFRWNEPGSRKEIKDRPLKIRPGDKSD